MFCLSIADNAYFQQCISKFVNSQYYFESRPQIYVRAKPVHVLEQIWFRHLITFDVLARSPRVVGAILWSQMKGDSRRNPISTLKRFYAYPAPRYIPLK